MNNESDVENDDVVVIEERDKRIPVHNHCWFLGAALGGLMRLIFDFFQMARGIPRFRNQISAISGREKAVN